eukprot:c30813_g1_i1 orf=345-596(+)
MGQKTIGCVRGQYICNPDRCQPPVPSITPRQHHKNGVSESDRNCTLPHICFIRTITSGIFLLDATNLQLFNTKGTRQPILGPV